VGCFVLNGAEDGGGDSVKLRVISSYDAELDKVSVFERFFREGGLPNAVFSLSEWVEAGIPVVKVPNK